MEPRVVDNPNELRYELWLGDELAGEIRYTRDMHLNTIRLEGKLETDEFFRLADEWRLRDEDARGLLGESASQILCTLRKLLRHGLTLE